MDVIECDVPPGSALSRELIGNAHFHDSYRAPLARPELGVVEIFFALFGHTPLWMKLLLIVRNAAARLVGANTSATTIAVAMGVNRAIDASARLTVRRAGSRPAPLMAMVMDVVGFEGGTIALPAHRTRIDSTQQEAHTRGSPSPS